jgi:hypothetical protein
MPDEGESTDRSWLVEPLGANEIRIHVDVGEGVELSDDARAAIDTLLDELTGDEVSGFAGTFPKCTDLNKCSSFICGLLNGCMLTRGPCFANVRCEIG